MPRGKKQTDGTAQAAAPAAQAPNGAAQARRWVGTFNNFATDFAADALPEWDDGGAACTYVTWQWEKVTTDHLQVSLTMHAEPC